MVTLINIPDASRNWGASMRTNLNNLNTGVEQARTLATAAVPGTAANNGQVFIKNGSGTLTGISYSSTATANTIAQRDASGQVNVATTPTANGHAASKSYVDAQVSTKYTKPSTGIPLADLASDVVASLARADGAMPGNVDSGTGTAFTDTPNASKWATPGTYVAQIAGTGWPTQYGTVITVMINANRCFQMVFDKETGRVWSRTGTGTLSWTPLVESVTSGSVGNSQVFAKTSSGALTGFNYSKNYADAGTVLLRTDAGQAVVADPTDPTHAATKAYSDAGDAAQVSANVASAKQVYIRNTAGTVTGLGYDSAAQPSQIVQRGSGGQITLPGAAPSAATDAAHKSYVDGATADLATNARLGARSLDVSTLDWNNQTLSGFYRGNNTVNSPDGSGSWFFVTVNAHSTDSWVQQTASEYAGSGGNALTARRTWVRLKQNNVWQPWTLTGESTGAVDATARTSASSAAATAATAVQSGSAANSQAFIKNSSGGVQGLAFDVAASGNSLVRRQSNGQITVPATPSATTDATSKTYVDNLVASSGGGGGTAYQSTEVVQGDLSLTDATDANNLRSWLEIAMDMGPTEYALSRLAPGVSKTLGVESVLPSGNANDEVAINAALARSSSVVLTGRYRLSGAIQIPSHTTLILKDAHLRLEDGLTSNIITNTNLAPNGNSHIRVVGIGRAVLDGNASTQVRSSTESWKNVGVHWVGVSNFQVSGITIRNTSNFSALHVGCSYGSWTNITLDQNRAVVNQDGIDFGPGNSYIFVDGVYGKVEDDVFSIFAKYSTGGGSVHPAFATGGDTHHLYFSNVFIDTFRSMFRMQAAEGSSLHHIYGNNCHITSVIRATSFVNFGELKSAYVKGPYPDTAGNDFYAIYLNNMSGRVNTMVRMSTNIKDVFISNLFSDNWQYIYGSGDGEQGNAYNINIDGVVTAYDGGDSYGNVVELDQANHKTDRLSITNMNLARVDRVTFSAMPVTNGILTGTIDQLVTRAFGGNTPWTGKANLTFKTTPPSAGLTPPTNPFTTVSN